MRLKDITSLIIHEDDDLIIINKPPFVPTLHERFSTENINIFDLAKAYNPDTQICHRLDKETSGALIIAKNAEAYRHVSMAFEKRKVQKTYHALVEGIHKFEDLTINLPILNVGAAHVKIDKQEGKKATTIFQSIDFFKHYTLVACQPITGRMHQIRIHLASLKASIAADEMYGGKEVLLSKIKRKYKTGNNEEAEQSLIKRFALHAYNLQFTAPNGQLIDITASYPKDFGTLLKLLSKYDV